MRYFGLLFFALFLILCVLFSMNNAEAVKIHFDAGWLGSYTSQKPLFVPIFFALALGIIFSVGYFFVYHSRLQLQIRFQEKEIRRLKKLVLLERESNQTMAQKNNDLEQISERLQHQINTKFLEQNANVVTRLKDNLITTHEN
ncbi:MAG: LapA family protein [SAR324 cluster bacterium]|nr:LapA family protein [SAR324 cluster bacterium]